MKIRSNGGTDPGKKRNNNEDSFLVADELFLYAVADGIGGNEGGEIASSLVLETMKEEFPALLSKAGTSVSESSMVSALHEAIILANKEVREVQSKNTAVAGMGTTLAALCLGKNSALTANVGDSRVYRSRGEALKQLTNDHSFVAEYVSAGLISEEEARQSPYRHVITRAVGTDDTVRPDIEEQDVKLGDRFLLCTDGLTEMLNHEEIRKIMASGSSPEETVKKLIADANDRGGVDNITAIVVWIEQV